MDDEILGEGQTPQTETETAAPETPEAEKPETSKELQSALAQKEHFREKYEKLQKEIEALKQPKTPEATPKAEVWEASSDPLEIVKLGKILKDNSEEETEFIIRNAPTKDIDGIIKAAKDPWVQTAIQAQREKAEKEQSVLAPSSPSGTESIPDSEKVVREGRELEEVARRMKELETKRRGEGT